MPLLTPTQPLLLATLAALLAADEPVRLAGSAPAGAEPAAEALPDAASPEASQLLAYAVGTGPELPPALVRRLLLLAAYRLARQPALNPALARRLLDFFSRDVWPVVPGQGPLAITDHQVPLAHLSLPLLGLGEVSYQGYRLAAADVLGLFGWTPLALRPSEAPALLLGHDYALAYATEALARTTQLLAAAEAIAALSASAYGPPPTPAPEATAFQCFADAHAAAIQALTAATAAVEAALNHPSQPGPLAAQVPPVPAYQAAPPMPPLLLDNLARAVAHVGSLSGRRTAELVAGGPELPRYLAAAPGQPGLLALPPLAASLVNQSQQLVFSVAFAENPDVHSAARRAGASGAAALLGVAEHTEQLLGLELLAAAQALDLRRPAGLRPAQAAGVAAFREHVTFVAQARVLAPDLHRAARFVREYVWP